MKREDVLEKLRNKQYIAILNSDEYKFLLTSIAQRITLQAKRAVNEATIENYFDCELFAFFKDVFEPLGYEYHPEKESQISTKRHISKGRADSAIGALVIEFKHYSKLANKTDRDSATSQISDYLLGLTFEENSISLGFVTDGINCCFVQQTAGEITVEAFEEISYKQLDRLVKNIILLELTALNSKNLVQDFCYTDSNSGIAYDIVNSLYAILANNIHPKTEMLFNEWKELFKLAHDDKSKQQAIINRRKSLEKIIGKKFNSLDEEYLSLYALQTSYAIIIKIVAFKIISKIRYNADLIDFETLLYADSNALRSQMFLLEDGAIFRTYGVTNLLEGDFFSWYASEHQWNDDLALQIRKTFKILSKYADKSVMNVAEKSQDFFKELYIEMIPDAVRRSLGEYYTKKWLAKQVVDEALSLADISNWRGLDPCCGSGTFVTVMIDKVLNEISELKDNEKLAILLKRVKGIDLNPIAVLTARVNYFINISHLLGDNTVLEIPIYLGDASYVPQKVIFDGVRCLQYTISTLLNPIEIIIPLSVVNDSYKFSHIMTKIEFDIKSLNSINVFKSLCELSDPADLTDLVLEKIKNLSDSLIQLEKREWNGIWARIITNFLTTANLGIFDIVVGNPPWVDWKNLPSGYRERIKSLCISRKLFSGDALTGGINLNICALIANVAAQNWLSPNGFLAFLMPEPLAFQPSYEGFRNLYLDNDERLYFQKFTNWTKAGNPFKPVTQKFLTYYISANEVDYREGIDTTFYIVKKGVQSSKIEDLDMDNSFTKKDVLLANCHTGKSSFSYIENKGDLRLFSLISGKSVYKGREGIEFYPQELMLFEKSELPSTQNCIALKNYQNDKSKHKIPSFNVLLETEFLFPMVKSVEIERFHLLENKYIVPFPYDEQNPKIPIELNELSRRAPNLANYYQSYKTIILSQTSYNEKIIGQKAEFYALARVGEYSYAKCLVAFRDNSNWKATVVTEIETEWGGKKRPLFQNHAVTICQDGEGKFIDFDEAHYICGILNAPVTSRYIMSSSDSRSYPIRPRIYIPKYNEQNETHRKISKLSKMAHEHYSDKKFIKEVDKQLDIQYIKLVSEQK